MPRALGYCWPCHEAGRDFVEATLMIDGDPHCATCARLAQPAVPKAVAEQATQQAIEAATAQRAAKTEQLCSRGCGRRTHHGRCFGAAAAAPAALPETVPTQEPTQAMETLIFEVVDDSAVPTILAQPRCTGRLGKLWSELTRLGPGKWLKVPNRNRIHAMNTARHTGTKAKKAQRKLETRVDGSTLYCRLEAR